VTDAPKKALLPDIVRFPLVLTVVCVAASASLAWLYGKTEAKIKESEKRKLEAAFKELAPGYVRSEQLEATPEAPGAAPFTYFRVLDKDGRILGYGCETVGPKSYNSLKPIRVVTVIGPDLKDVKVLGMRVSFSEETPGLGERIKEKPAANSILGLALGRPSLARVKSDAVPVALVRVLENDGKTVKVEYDSPGAGVQQKSVPADQIQFLDFIPWFQEQFTGLGESDLKLKKDGGRVDGITGATISSRASLGAVTEAVRQLKACAKPQAAGESN